MSSGIYPQISQSKQACVVMTMIYTGNTRQQSDYNFSLFLGTFVWGINKTFNWRIKLCGSYIDLKFKTADLFGNKCKEISVLDGN